MGLSQQRQSQSWRKVRDSNPRFLAEHDISSVAPSTSRTTFPLYLSSRSPPDKQEHYARELTKNKLLKTDKSLCLCGFCIFLLPTARLDFECDPFTARILLHAPFGNSHIIHCISSISQGLSLGFYLAFTRFVCYTVSYIMLHTKEAVPYCNTKAPYPYKPRSCFCANTRRPMCRIYGATTPPIPW